MAKVKHISLETIKALAGIIDFYFWKGIPCARKWPDWTRFRPSPRQKASMEAFKKIRADLKKLQIEVVNAWRQTCTGKGNSWVDLFTYLWFQFWKAGIDPAPVLKRYRIETTQDTIYLYMDWSAPVQSHIVIGDGYSKATRRVTMQKGKPQPCYDPPKPIPPSPPIPPIPINPPQTEEEELGWDAGNTQKKDGWGESENFQEAVKMAWDMVIQSDWVWDRETKSGVEVQAAAISWFPEMPTIYSVWVIIRRRWDRYRDYIWEEKHPGVEPTYIRDNNSHTYELENIAQGTIKLGYAEVEGKEFKPGTPSYNITPKNINKEIKIDYKKEYKASDGGIYILTEPDNDLYFSMPPQPQPGEYTRATMEIVAGHPAGHWRIGRATTTYTASIPKTQIQHLSQPTAFIYSHNMPAVAPPIPIP